MAMLKKSAQRLRDYGVNVFGWYAVSRLTSTIILILR